MKSRYAFVLLWSTGCGHSAGSGTPDHTASESLSVRLNSLETSTQESIERIESMIDILQVELSQQRPAAAPAVTEPVREALPPPPSEPDPNLKSLVAEALGVSKPPVTRQKNEFRVNRDWCKRELTSMLTGKKPNIASNRGEGLRVRGVRRGSFLATLGLKNNDVVLSINGTPTNTPKDASTNLIESKGELSVKFRRGREEMTYTYSWK